MFHHSGLILWYFSEEVCFKIALPLKQASKGLAATVKYHCGAGFSLQRYHACTVYASSQVGFTYTVLYSFKVDNQNVSPSVRERSINTKGQITVFLS